MRQDIKRLPTVLACKREHFNSYQYVLDISYINSYYLYMADGIKIFIRAVIKGVSGFIIIPMGIFVYQVKPGWEVASVPVKIFTGMILVPMVIFLYFAMPWWQNFKIS
jgi:hypothetical protein